MALRACHAPECARRRCLSCLLTKEEMALIAKTDSIFEMLNTDSECQAKYCFCCYEERITPTEVHLLKSVMQKPFWREAGDKFGEALTATVPGLIENVVGQMLPGGKVVATALHAVAPALFGGGGEEPGTSTHGEQGDRGYQLTKLMVEKLEKAQGTHGGLTKKEVRDAVMAVAASYAAGAMEVMIHLLEEEAKTLRPADVSVRTGAPANEEIRR